ncbi:MULTISPECIES: hypothetical protein [unclassified Robiginitalea]|uniref:hypothetical protein n=1 Tax=Robiginitalea TaxID=252306 RepID=UPI00234B2EF6|nr:MULTISPECIES: hypothetical protein [unclassified Robiginitalea]MDC6354857.1 hypothetical protein [Robiginitalea sp. PM2]MDC6375123.1 hypothetical protein [Robiginitalea sp. SP8]
MAIRLGSSCMNCDNMMSDSMCKVHGVKVASHYTCDHFEMKAELTDHRDCTSCQRYERDDCANPAKASPGMMCSVWAPREFRA